jgi:hypothetical protein
LPVRFRYYHPFTCPALLLVFLPFYINANHKNSDNKNKNEHQYQHD